MSVKNIRTKQNLTQEELSTKLNVDRSTIAKWETGASTPRLTTLIKMSKLFNCTVDDLIDATKAP